MELLIGDEMNDKSKIYLALEIATKAHLGQTDKLGANYIDHPLRVHRNLLTHPEFQALDAGSKDDCEVAALLHDVIEDSGTGEGSQKFTKEDLLSLGFTPRSVELVVLLTRVEGVDKDDYYRAINDNPLARLVKWADIADNLNAHRVEELDIEDAERLADKYRKALVALPLTALGIGWMELAKQHSLQTEPLGASADREWEAANESAEAESDLPGYSDVYPEADPEPESSWDEEEG
jgi:(p)ppGpp synthase/HD superfamily hydrolase